MLFDSRESEKILFYGRESRDIIPTQSKYRSSIVETQQIDNNRNIPNFDREGRDIGRAQSKHKSSTVEI